MSSRMSSRRHEFLRAIRHIRQVIPTTQWQGGIHGRMSKLFWGNSFLKYRERLSVVVFLYCNGIDRNDIVGALSHRLRDRSATNHVLKIIESLVNGTHSPDWFYFDVDAQHKRYVDGRTKYEACYAHRERVSEWDRLCRRHYCKYGTYPSIEIQTSFFASAVEGLV